MRGPDSAAPPLEITLFGPFDARVNGVNLRRLRSRRGNWLLALLVLRHGSEVDRAWLAGTLWPDSSEKQALGSLRMSLTDLRRALGPEAKRLQSPTARTLAIELAGAEVDVLAFDAALARGDTASLETAVALRRGLLLEGCGEEWVFEERQAREQEYLLAMEKLAARAMAQGAPATAVRYLRQVIAAEPLRESAHRSLMESLAAAGNYAAATAVYRDLRVLLHRELNDEPAPETSALFHQIRAEARRLAEGKEGERERAKEGTATAPSSLPPVTRSLPHSLSPSFPRPLTEFVGRDRQIGEVETALQSARLVTLMGTGGVGKTRLAIRVAEEMAADFPDGVCFIELGGLADPALIPQAVAAVLQAHEEPSRPLKETLLDFLGARRLLLVLDNCEHVIDACAHWAAALLQGCPELRILATSRQALGITGEKAWRVPSLSLPEASGVRRQASGEDSTDRSYRPDASHLMNYEAVRLFVQRAKDALAAFDLTDQNAPAVLQICCRLDGIPLAIELAAARLRLLSVEQIAERLDDHFRLLSKGSRTAPPRQQTLRATMDWSHDLLAEPERVMLRRLAVFPSSFTLDAAEAICADPVGSWQLAVGSKERRPPSGSTGNGSLCSANSPPPTANRQLPTDAVLDLLGQLVDKSLVLVDEQGAAARYRLLETVRHYAAEKLAAAGETGALRERHRDWFLELAERTASDLRGADQGVRLERIDREHENLRAAMGWCVERGNGEPGLRLAGALGWFWLVRGYLTEGRKRLAEILALDAAAIPTGGREPEEVHAAATSSTAAGREAASPRARAKALDAAGLLATEQGEYEAASALLREALAICRELGDAVGMASALNGLGSVARCRDDYGTARALIEESLAIERDVDDDWGIAASLYHLGSMAQAQGDYGAARALLEEALEIQRHLGDHRSIAKSLRCLAYLASQQGDFTTARARSGESLTIARELRARELIAAALAALGDHARFQGEYGGARSLYEESLSIARELGDQEGIATLLQNLGHTAAAQGDFATARAISEQSLAIVRRLGARKHIAWSLDHLARATLHEGELEGARGPAEESLAIRRALGDRGGIASSLCTLGEVARRRRDHAAARACFQESLVIRLEQGDRNGIAECLEGLAAVAAARAAPASAQTEQAAHLWAAAEALREQIGAPLTPAERADQELRVAAARAAIGAEAFTAAWMRGRELSVEESVREALGDA